MLKRTIFVIIFLFLILSKSSSLFAQCQWIEASGEASIENLTPTEARKLAINLARVSAIEKGVGVNVQGVTIVKDLAFLTDVVETISQGYILEEKLIEWEAKIHQETKQCFPIVTYIVRLSVCISGSGERDPYFKVRADLNKMIFREKEDAELTIWVSQDGYVNIFNWTADDKINIVTFNDSRGITPIRANTEFKYPPHGTGLKVEMTLEGKHNSEYFIIVVTRQPFNFAKFLGREKDVPLPDFYKALLSIPSQERAEVFLPYMILSSH